MNVQEVAAAKALLILKAAGAQFHIRMGDGAEYGEPIAKQRKKYTRAAENMPSLLHHYQTPIANMQIGDVLQLPFPEGIDRMRFKTNAQAYARHKHGADTCVVGSTETHVEILRVQ